MLKFLSALIFYGVHHFITFVFVDNMVFISGDFQLEYNFLRKKDSNKVVICFHGFGRDLHDFDLFKESFENNESILSIHLFQHGQSKVADHRLWKIPIQKEEIKELFKQLFVHLNIDTFSLLGYSMGGKLCLVLVELFPEKAKRLILIAPDGIRISPAYVFSSRTKLGTYLFRRIIDKPKVFFAFVDLFKKIRVITKSQHRVITINLETYEKRKQVGETWYSFSRLDPNIAMIKSHINEKEIETVLLYGDFDKVIPAKQGHQFIKGIDKGTIHIIQQGHALMNKKVAIALKKVISDK